MNLNLTEWAIRRRSLVIYFMLVVVVAGVGSYLRLGRSEDPDFTVKTMVVQVGWPGATVSDTLEQITDRLERKLEETPSLDYLKSYTTPGMATIFVYLKDLTHPAKVPDIWYQVRKKVYDIKNDLPQGIVGPGFNDEFGDTYGIVYGFTAVRIHLIVRKSRFASALGILFENFERELRSGHLNREIVALAESSCGELVEAPQIEQAAGRPQAPYRATAPFAAEARPARSATRK